METKPFQHKRSAKFMAFRYAFVSIAFAFMVQFVGLEYLVKAEPAVKNYILYGTWLLCLCIWGVYVIPNFLKKGFFEIIVNESGVHCNYPDKEGFKIRLKDIKELRKALYHAQSPAYGVRYYIVTQDGQKYFISNFDDLSPEKVFKAIQKFKPELEVVKKFNP